MPDVSSGRSAGALAQEEKAAGDGLSGAARMERIAFALHEMCQPLMTLQCRLEIGKMIGTADGYEEAVKEGLAECERLLLSVDVLRNEVVRGLEAERPS